MDESVKTAIAGALEAHRDLDRALAEKAKLEARIDELVRRHGTLQGEALAARQAKQEGSVAFTMGTITEEEFKQRREKLDAVQRSIDEVEEMLEALKSGLAAMEHGRHSIGNHRAAVQLAERHFCALLFDQHRARVPAAVTQWIERGQMLENLLRGSGERFHLPDLSPQRRDQLIVEFRKEVGLPT